MSSKKAYSKSQWYKYQWTTLVFTLLITLVLLALPGNTKEKKRSNHTNRLPPAPDTGAPEEDFSAGGTRDNQRRDSICGINRRQIAYLLGNRNREFTLSAYPTFWFHIPNTMNKVAQIKFAVTELETGKKIYARAIDRNHRSRITGINLPAEQQYALSPKANYAWSLGVDCAGTERKSEIVLQGWITRVSSQSDLQNQLAAVPEAEKYMVYLKHNLLYDALTQLAQSHIAKPNDVQIETAWNRLLTKLGWQELIQQKSAIKPSIPDLRIGIDNH